MRFQVSFEVIRFLLAGKADVTLDFPGDEFRGVSGAACVVIGYALLQIGSCFDIDLIGIGRAADDINIMHG